MILQLENLFKAGNFVLPSNISKGEIFLYQVDIPTNYEVSECIYSAGVETSDISNNPIYATLETSLSFSCSKNGVIKVSSLNNPDGNRRKVSYTIFLKKKYLL